MLLSKNTLSMCLMVTLISFLGFVTENIWLAITKGFMNNRNMCFPFLFGYGLAVMILYKLFNIPSAPTFLGKPLMFHNPMTNIIYYIFAVALCISIGESLLGTFVEKTCHIQWWNYSALPLHIGKYTCIFTSLGFASLITLFMYFCFCPLYHFFMNQSYNILLFASAFFMLIMVGDFMYSALLMFKNKSLTERWFIDMAALRGRQ